MSVEKMTIEQHMGRGHSPLKLPQLGSFKQERKDDFKKIINWLARGGGLDVAKYWAYAVDGKPKDGTIPEHWFRYVDGANSDTFHLVLGVEKVTDPKKTPVITINRINDSGRLYELCEKYNIKCLIRVQKRR